MNSLAIVGDLRFVCFFFIIRGRSGEIICEWNRKERGKKVIVVF